MFIHCTASSVGRRAVRHPERLAAKLHRLELLRRERRLDRRDRRAHAVDRQQLHLQRPARRRLALGLAGRRRSEPVERSHRQQAAVGPGERDERRRSGRRRGATSSSRRRATPTGRASAGTGFAAKSARVPRRCPVTHITQPMSDDQMMNSRPERAVAPQRREIHPVEDRTEIAPEPLARASSAARRRRSPRTRRDASPPRRRARSGASASRRATEASTGRAR